MNIVGSLKLYSHDEALPLRLGRIRTEVQFYNTPCGITDGIVYVPVEVTALKNSYTTLTSVVAYIENMAGGAILKSAKML